jgi:hypothetical protein
MAARRLAESQAAWALGGYVAFLVVLCTFALRVSHKDWHRTTAQLRREIEERAQALRNG